MRSRILLLAALAAVALPAAADNKIPIASEGTVGDRWTLVAGSQLMPPYPDDYAGQPENVCLVIGYLVNADGRTSDFSLLKSWTSGSHSRNEKFWADFGNLASRALAQWRYVPAANVPAAPVYTAATFVFSAPGDVVDTRSHCALVDLTTRLVELRFEPRARRLMAGGVFSRLDIDPYLAERIHRQLIAERERADDHHMSARVLGPARQNPPPPPPPTPPGNK
ncbi:MAG TPA: hypothetical protein VL118_01860 [Luteimonas sp.]|nr:hypothetical protein [Luteimonas sp.]